MSRVTIEFSPDELRAAADALYRWEDEDHGDRQSARAALEKLEQAGAVLPDPAEIEAGLMEHMAQRMKARR